MRMTFRRGYGLSLLAVSLLSGTALAQQDMGLDDTFRAGLREVSESLATGQNSIALQRASTLAKSADRGYEKYAVGQLMLQAASAGNDPRSERDALNLMLESGAVPPTQLGELRAKAGILSAMLGDRKDAEAQISYANRQGYMSALSQLALADAQFQSRNVEGGTASLEQAIDLRAKAGETVDAAWFDRAIALSYQARRPDLVARWTLRKLAGQPTPADWRSGVLNYVAGAGLTSAQTLDLYRLLAATQGLASGRDWQAYSTFAQQAGSPAEAKAALDSGVREGDLDASEPDVQKALAALRPKAVKAMADAEAQEKKARAGGGAQAALAAADAQFALAAYPKAVELYQLALSRGGAGVDVGQVQTRLGIAQARSANLEAARATLAGVTGPWAGVAGFWSSWIARQAARNPA